MEPSSQQGPIRSFIEVVHEAPTVLDVLSPAALKNLSSTCKTLRTSFCASVTVISVPDPEDASKLCFTTWPKLVMVVCNPGAEMKSHLSAQWTFMMEVVLFLTVSLPVNAILLRSSQEPDTALLDLTSQHFAALSQLADKHRRTAQGMQLQGPLVGCRVHLTLMTGEWPILQFFSLADTPQLGLESVSHLSSSLPSLANISIENSFLEAAALLKLHTCWPGLQCINLSNNQLDTSGILAITQVRWSNLRYLDLDFTTIGIVGMQHLVSCSWLLLDHLGLRHTCIDIPSLQCLAQGVWPMLRWLNLMGNSIDATGITYLMQGNWPLLEMLILSAQGIDEEACSLLGIAEADISGIMLLAAQNLDNPSHRFTGYQSDLPQFPCLSVQIRKN